MRGRRPQNPLRASTWGNGRRRCQLTARLVADRARNFSEIHLEGRGRRCCAIAAWRYIPAFVFNSPEMAPRARRFERVLGGFERERLDSCNGGEETGEGF